MEVERARDQGQQKGDKSAPCTLVLGVVEACLAEVGGRGGGRGYGKGWARLCPAGTMPRVAESSARGDFWFLWKKDGSLIWTQTLNETKRGCVCVFFFSSVVASVLAGFF